MSGIEEREPVPACADAIERTHQGETKWRWTREFDLDTFEPCSYCFGDKSINDIDIPLRELIVTGKSGRKIHRHEDTGPVNYADAISTRGSKELNRRLREMGPEDLDLGCEGGDC